MFLGARLQTVAGLAGDYRRFADVGSDHAYLPVWLVRQGKADYVVAGEIMPGPLEAARRTVDEAALADRIAVRLGDGLTVLEAGEVDAVIIAGMGGASIRGILDRSPQITGGLSRLICQPMVGAAGLRLWLFKHGWLIVAEELVQDDGRLYEVLAAEPGAAELPDPLLLEVGPLLWRNRHPLLPQQLERLLKQYRMRVAEMQQSTVPSVLKQKNAWQQRIDQLEAMRECL